MTSKLLIVLLIGLFSVSGGHAAGVGADCGGCSAQSNNENLARATQLTEEALAHAKQGHQTEALSAITEAKTTIKLIVSGNMTKAMNKSRAVYEMDDARRRARDGKLEESIAFMEKALPYMSEIGTFE